MRDSTRRAARIARILTRHGLEYLVDVVGLEHLVRPHDHQDAKAGPAHLRSALEELGPTFVKLGQLLSTRPDLIPPAYEAELTVLQDSMPPAPWNDVARTLKRALGRPVTDAFATFEREPLAAASIGQVHAATLTDGTPVAVKVRRPHIVAQVDQDLELLDRLATVAQRRWSLAARYDPVGLAHEFARTLHGELDYHREGTSADRIRTELRANDRVHVPLVHWDHCATDVLTLERVGGRKITDLEGLDADGVNRTRVARDFCDMYLQMVFVHGFFHADPHPGNVFVQTDGTIALVDYGMVGHVEDDTRHALGRVLVALVGADADGLAAAMADLGVAPPSDDVTALRDDLAEFMGTYRTATLADLQVRVLLGDMLAVIRRHHLTLPHQLALLLKTVTTAEGVAQQLDPSFELLPLLVPYAAALEQPAPGS
ncbi:MAG TPA: AarF/ABC1/UbiB kinase family protein [Acidimicrobiia bacterium]|jgi:ubiquinone biosynthesis protein